MHDHAQYQIVIAGESATVYLFENLALSDESALVAHCRELPGHVRILRVDARGLGALTATGMGAVRALFAAWRERREGHFALRSSYLVATARQLESAA